MLSESEEKPFNMADFVFCSCVSADHFQLHMCTNMVSLQLKIKSEMENKLKPYISKAIPCFSSPHFEGVGLCYFTFL